MSQSKTETADGTEQSDADNPLQTFQEKVTAAREVLETLDESDVSDAEDLHLVELRSELKDLEDIVETARKDITDGELKDRMTAGETLYGLSLIESHNKYLKDEPGAVVGRAVQKGIDYTEFVDVNASKLAEIAPEIGEIGKYEYTYLR